MRDFGVKLFKHQVGPKPELEHIVYSDLRMKKRFYIFWTVFRALGLKVGKKC
jgi:hypothetical protein